VKAYWNEYLDKHWNEYLEMHHLPLIIVQRLLEGYHDYLLKNKQFILEIIQRQKEEEEEIKTLTRIAYLQRYKWIFAEVYLVDKSLGLETARKLVTEREDEISDMLNKKYNHQGKYPLITQRFGYNFRDNNPENDWAFSEPLAQGVFARETYKTHYCYLIYTFYRPESEVRNEKA